MSTLLFIIEIAVALGLIIFVHELGHFLAAKGFGVWVRRFAIGFGPVILRWRRGGPLPEEGMPAPEAPNRYETEYSLRAFPLGGFVEPMGEHPDSEGGDDPRALWRRPAWQRIIVFAAGVFMNALLAIVFFAAASLIGINAASTKVDGVTPLLPAEKAGIKAGDRIVSINGTAVESFIDVMAIIASSDAGASFDVTVDRRESPEAPPVRRTFEGMRSQRDPNGATPVLGIEPALEPVAYAMIPGFPADQAGLKAGDKILAVGGKPVTRFRQIDEYLSAAPPGPVTLAVEREGKRLDLTIDPAKQKTLDLGLEPPILIRAADADGPAAKAGVRSGDRVLRVGDKAWPSPKEFSETIKAAGDGGTVRLQLWRDGQVVEVTSGVAAYTSRKEPLIGVALTVADKPPLMVGAVAPDGPAAKAGIAPGDIIEAMGEKAVKPHTWEDVLALFYQADGKPLVVRLKRGESPRTAILTPAVTPAEKALVLGIKPGQILFEPLPRLYNPLQAAARGVNRTLLWFERVYANLRQLAKRQVSTESVGGPVMIFSVSYGFATKGLGTFIDLWGILSVCVAVFNFLPVPPFDGGHVLFVIIEALGRRRINPKVRAWIWGAGWVAVGLLFLVITYRDILRLL